jgi:hypothetical protein
MFETRKGFLDCRSDFERNFNILAELLREGRMTFSIHSKKSVEGLRKIRRLPNGRIDLNTIDELARTTANMAGNFEHMKKRDDQHEAKK